VILVFEEVPGWNLLTNESHLLMLKKDVIFRIHIKFHSVRLFISIRFEIYLTIYEFLHTSFDLNWQVNWAGVWHG
jgi:hypothetical protein